MSRNQIILSSLALDLRRVAQGYYRGSDNVAERFYQEALKRKNEAEVNTLKPYLRKLLKMVEELQFIDDKQKKSEKALMYSVLFQNAALVL